MIPLQNYHTWASILTVFHLVAFGATIFRLVYRFRIRRLWLDDYVAGFALLVDFMYFVVLWLRYHLGNPQHSIKTRATMYYISSFCFFIVVWSARASMALSLTRIIPSGLRMKNLTNLMAVFFALCGVALVMQIAIVCGRDESWQQTVNVQCSGTSWVSAFTLDMIGDIALIAVPLIMLWRVALPRNQRLLVFAVFTASIFTCLASIALHVFLLGPKTWGPGAGKLVLFMSHVEATIALIVCNLLVIVTYFYRTFRHGVDLESAEDTVDQSTAIPPMSQTYVASQVNEKESISSTGKD